MTVWQNDIVVFDLMSKYTEQVHVNVVAIFVKFEKKSNIRFQSVSQ